MSERFEVLFYGDVINCVKDETGKEYNLHELISILMEQQATISALTKENKELGKNFEDLVEWVSGIAKRNVVLDEKIGELQRENEQLRLELETHKHPLWSTREAERKVNKLADSLADEVEKNGLLNEEINQLRIENMRLKKN